MDLADLQSAVEHLFSARAGEFGLDAGPVRAEYVLNWGGFVNRSFRVTDGRRSVHLKLAVEGEPREQLRRWFALRDLLAARYRAPRVIDWIDVPGTDAAGLLFEHIEGRTPAGLSPDLERQVLPIVAALHADGDLAERIAPSGDPGTCADTFLGTFHERFTEDLAHVEAWGVPFIDRSTIEWMRGEAERLAETVRASAAFALPADRPVHGDLWVNNLRVTDAGDVYLLDWDDLALGDPAIDYAILLGPSAADLHPISAERISAVASGDAALRERLAVYARATLLDWTIDPLADWVEAAGAPEHVGHVRPEKERVHRAARALYLDLFG